MDFLRHAAGGPLWHHHPHEVDQSSFQARGCSEPGHQQPDPGLALPNTNITVVYRSDPSGSSLLWTEFLSHSSSAWAEEVDVALQNRSGQFVQASRAAFSAAAQTADWRAADGFQQLPTDPPGSGSWPITGASFILVDRSRERARGTAQVLQFFDWALHRGGSIAHRLDYVPLPARVVEQLPSLWGTLRDSSGMPLWPQ
jgi:phosphate transport system substrate-binding protein